MTIAISRMKPPHWRTDESSWDKADVYLDPKEVVGPDFVS
jgi:hypothetical protein